MCLSSWFCNLSRHRKPLQRCGALDQSDAYDSARTMNGGRASMKAIAWIVIAASIIGLAVLALWDEGLDPEARKWLQPVQRIAVASDNGYFALLGLFAGAQDSAP